MYTGDEDRRDRFARYLLKILERAPYENITVTRVAEAADLPKRYFFQCFESKDQVLCHALDQKLEMFAAKTGKRTFTDICSAVRLLFSFFKEERHTMRLYITNGQVAIIRDRCHAFLMKESQFECNLDGVDEEEERRYALYFIVNGIVGLLEQCVREDSFSDEQADMLVNLVCRITGSASCSDDACAL